MANPTETELRKLTVIHLKRYASRIIGAIERPEKIGRVVNMDDCRMYFQIWLNVADANFVFNQCDPDSQREIRDAIASGELLNG